MDKYYFWFNVVFLMIAIYLFKSVKPALMFTIVIGVPLSYVLKSAIMGRVKKKTEEVIIDVTKEVEITTKKDTNENKKNINVTINLNVNDENINKENIKKAVSDAIDAVVEDGPINNQ